MTEITQNNPSPRRLHENAMDLADQGLRLKKAGQRVEASEFFQRAYLLEAQAAALTKKEPSRSVLHRSAASLALEFGGTREAEKLIATCLAGDPPEGLAEELRNLLETVHFQRHLRLQGIQLGEREFQFSIAGAGVDYGAAPSDAVLKRVSDVQKMLFRTAQRKRNIPFEQATKAHKKSDEDLTLYMEVARAASYAVTLRLGQRVDAEPLFTDVNSFPSEIIDEVLECIDLVDRESFEVLEEKIGEKSYYENFLALSRNIAPDGDTVSVVGFTSLRDNEEKQVKLSLTREKIGRKIKESTSVKEASIDTNQDARIKGTLRAADSIKNNHHIKLVGDDGKIYTIIVPRELMTDIVRPHYGNHVEIVGNWFGPKRIVLADLIPS